MRKFNFLIVIFFVLGCNCLKAQSIELKDDETYSSALRRMFSSIPYGAIPYGILYDRVPGWSGLTHWKSGDTTSFSHIKQTWYDLEQAMNVPTSRYSGLRDRIELARYQGVLSLIAVNCGLSYIDPDALVDGRMRVFNGQVLIQPWAMRSGSACVFRQKRLHIASIAAEEVVANKDYVLQVSEEFSLVNLSMRSPVFYVVQNITTGERWHLAANGEVTVKFTHGGVNTLRIEAYFDGAVFASIQQIKVSDFMSQVRRGEIDANEHKLLTSSIPFKGYGETVATISYADYHIFYHYRNGAVEHKLQKPVIIIDGFDPKDDRTYKGLYNEKLKYGNSNLGEEMRQRGYDVVVLNFPVGGTGNGAKNYANVDIPLINGVIRRDGGTDYIERNAFLLVALIEELNRQLKQNGSAEQLVVVGPSMGGQISRYALAYMEKQGLDHNTRLWVSFDSPHLGANIPIALQKMLHFAGYTCENQDAVDAFEKQLNNPAARQMLIERFDRVDEYHTRYYAALQSNGLSGSNGFPQKLRKIALVNGSGVGKNVHTAGTRFLTLSGKKLGINFVDFKCYFVPDYNRTTTVFEGKMPVLDAKWYKLLTWTWTITVPHSKLERFNSNLHGSMDVVPGGMYNAQRTVYDDFCEALKESGLETSGYIASNHCFIPTVSALAFKNPDFKWTQNISNRDLVQTGETPFDAYFVPSDNQEHVQLTAESAQWLINQIDGGADYNHLADFYMNGPDKVCSNSTFQLFNIPAGASIKWQYSDNLICIGGTESAKLVVRNAMSPASNTGWVQPTITLGGISRSLPAKSVYVGSGEAPSIMGPYDGDLVAMEICPCKPSYFRVVDKAQGVSQYEWTLTGDGLPTMYAGDRADFFVSREGRYTISCRQYHEGCGWSEPTEQSFYASSMAGNCPSCNGHIISPNPGIGIIRIAPAEEPVRGTRSASPIQSVRIFNQQGVQVLYRSFGSGQPEVHIDLSQLRPGTYHLLINGTEHHVVVRE